MRISNVLVVTAAFAAVLAAGCATEREQQQTSKPASIAPGSSVDARGALTLDGQKEDVTGKCTAPADGKGVNISLAGTSATKVNVTVDNSQPPKVTSVVLATGSAALQYQPGQDGNAEATNDGNSYHITGTLVGENSSKKQFDITAICS